MCDTNIFCLQEVHSDKTIENRWKTEWGGKAYFSHGQSNARGVAILLERSLDIQLHNLVRDGDGRFLILDITINKIRCTIANCYAPNQDCPEFFITFFSEISKFNNCNLVVTGDLNTTLTAKDKNKGKCLHPKATNCIINYMDTLDLVDIWRVQHPDTFQFTWKRIKPNKTMERLDYIFDQSKPIYTVSDLISLPVSNQTTLSQNCTGRQKILI